jgi:hypothetical protein
MSGAIPLLNLCPFMACAGTNLTVPFLRMLKDSEEKNAGRAFSSFMCSDNNLFPQEINTKVPI